MHDEPADGGRHVDDATRGGGNLLAGVAGGRYTSDSPRHDTTPWLGE
jgi:hypothetical protein